MATAPSRGRTLLRHQADRRPRRGDRGEGHQLKRAVGALDLTALGLGAIIGTGIFVIIGEAIDDLGPVDRPRRSCSPA